MSRTLRTSPDGTLTRDGRITHSERRPVATLRRQGTRTSVLAAVLRDLEV